MTIVKVSHELVWNPSYKTIILSRKNKTIKCYQSLEYLSILVNLTNIIQYVNFKLKSKCSLLLFQISIELSMKNYKVSLLLFILTILVCAEPNDDTYIIGQRINSVISSDGTGNTLFLINVNQIRQTEYLQFAMSVPSNSDFYKKYNFTVHKGGEQQLLTCDKSSCLLQPGNVAKDDILVVLVQCKDGCKFIFAANYIPVRESKIGEQIDLAFSDIGASYIFSIQQIPSDFQQVQVLLVPKYGSSITDRIHLLSSTGATITQNLYEKEGLPLWKGGQGIFFSKKQEVANKRVKLLATGFSKAFYTLEIKVVKEQTKQIQYNLVKNEYLQKNSTKSYIINFPSIQTSSKQTFYFLEFVIFSGQLQVGLYTDEELENSFELKPFTHRGNTKYVISRSKIMQQNISSLYLKTSSLSSETTLTILFSRQIVSQFTKIQEGVYTFFSVDNKKMIYYQFDAHQSAIELKDLQFVLRDFELAQTPMNISFSLCSSDLQSCIDDKKNITALNATKTSRTTQNLFKVNVNFETKNFNYGTLYLLIQVTAKQGENGFVAMYLNDDNKLSIISELNNNEEIISIEQSRYYYYKNEAKNIQELSFHLANFLGRTNFSVYRQDPRRTDSIPLYQSNQITNNYKITESITQPIYLKVTGISQAYYIIGVETLTSQQLDDSNQANIQRLAFKHGTEYSMLLKRGQDNLIDILDKDAQNIQFSIQSTGRLAVCQLANITDICNHPVTGNKFAVNFTNSANKQKGHYLIKIINTNQYRNIEVSALYRYPGQNECELKQMNKIHEQIIQAQKCFKFNIEKAKHLTVMFKQKQMTYLITQVKVCGKQLQRRDQIIFQIEENQIQQFCSSAKQQDKTVTIKAKSSFNSTQKIKVQYMVQTGQNSLLLPQGLAYLDVKNKINGVLNYYRYKVLNQMDTYIFFQQKQGSIEAYIKIVENDENLNQRSVGPNNYDFSTKDFPSFFFTKVKKIKIPQSMLNCTNCMLLIAVHSDNTTVDATGIIAYTVEISQGSNILNQHEPHNNLLFKGSRAYYQYECKIGKTAFIDVSDNGENCVKMFLSDNEFPTQDQNIDVLLGNHMQFPCEKRVYFIGVQAIQNCPLSITAQSSDLRITKITNGVPISLNLKQNQTIFFSFYHVSYTPFKLLALEKYGSVNIKLGPATQEMLNQIALNPNQIADKLKLKNSFKNGIEVETSQDQFCDNCVYIVAVTAVDPVLDATFLYLNEQQPIPMSVGKVLYDQLQQNEKTHVNYHNIKKGTVNVDVISGSVDVEISFGGSQILKQSFSTQSQTQIFAFDFTNRAQNPWEPIKILIKNSMKDKCLYSLTVFKDNDLASNAQTIKMGIPMTIKTDSDDKVCIKGYLLNEMEQILLSVDKKEKENFAKLQLDIIVNGEKKDTNQISELVQNVRVISLQKNQIDKKQSEYIVCFYRSPEHQLQITVVQSDKLNILAPYTWGVVKGKTTFMIQPSEQFLVDVYTCKGSVDYATTTNYTELSETKQMKRLDDTNNEQNNHQIYFSNQTQDSQFIEFASEKALVHWMQINPKTDQGKGYQTYAIGDFSYQLTQNSPDVTFNWQGIHKIIQSRSQLKNVSYKILVAPSRESLKAAMNCELFTKDQSFYSTTIVDDMKSEQNTFTVKKSDIREQFQSGAIRKTFKKMAQLISKEVVNVYIGLIADATVEVKKQNGQPVEEIYRFMYKELEVPQILLTQDPDSKKNDMLLIILTISGLFVIVLCSFYIILKKIAPLISRLLGSTSVWEEEQEKKQEKPVLEDQRDTDKQIAQNYEI